MLRKIVIATAALAALAPLGAGTAQACEVSKSDRSGNAITLADDNGDFFEVDADGSGDGGYINVSDPGGNDPDFIEVSADSSGNVNVQGRFDSDVDGDGNQESVDGNLADGCISVNGKQVVVPE